jgi:hypothetical protein
LCFQKTDRYPPGHDRLSFLKHDRHPPGSDRFLLENGSVFENRTVTRPDTIVSFWEPVLF